MPTPSYLASYQVLPSWQRKPDEHKSLDYRCDRLAGLTNLYFWSMTWTIHRARKWTLGLPAVHYVYGQPILWLIGLETIRDFAEFAWGRMVEFAQAHIESSNVYGSFRPSRIKRSKKKFDYSVVPESWSGGSRADWESTLPRFVGDDRLTAIVFRDRLDCVPWPIVTGALHQAFINAERHLKEEEIRWNGPPWFRTFQDGRELLDDARLRKRNAAILLADIEAERRRRIAEIETVLRAKAQRDSADSDEMDLTDWKAKPPSSSEAPGTTDSPRPSKHRVSVQLNPPVVTLDDTNYVVRPDGAILVSGLLAAEGDWKSGKALGIERADRVYKVLPPPIRELVESAPSKGFRIKRSKLA